MGVAASAQHVPCPPPRSTITQTINVQSEYVPSTKLGKDGVGIEVLTPTLRVTIPSYENRNATEACRTAAGGAFVSPTTSAKVSAAAAEATQFSECGEKLISPTIRGIVSPRQQYASSSLFRDDERSPVVNGSQQEDYFRHMANEAANSYLYTPLATRLTSDPLDAAAGGANVVVRGGGGSECATPMSSQCSGATSGRRSSSCVSFVPVATRLTDEGPPLLQGAGGDPTAAAAAVSADPHEGSLMSMGELGSGSSCASILSSCSGRYASNEEIILVSPTIPHRVQIARRSHRNSSLTNRRSSIQNTTSGSGGAASAVVVAQQMAGGGPPSLPQQQPECVSHQQQEKNRPPGSPSVRRPQLDATSFSSTIDYGRENINHHGLPSSTPPPVVPLVVQKLANHIHNAASFAAPVTVSTATLPPGEEEEDVDDEYTFEVPGV